MPLPADTASPAGDSLLTARPRALPWPSASPPPQDQVGGGGFSIVHRGLWKGTPVAIKLWFDPQHTEQLMQVGKP